MTNPPTTLAPAQVAPKSAASKPLFDHAPHVLVVDDDTRIRTLLSSYLAREGFRVTTAASAEAARAQLSSIAFDGLILDVMMPGENGFDLARDLKKSADTPILMLTARAEAEDRVTGLEIGADDYLPKPFDPRELLLRLTNVLRRSGAKHSPEGGAPKSVRFGAFSFNLERGEQGQHRPLAIGDAHELAVAMQLAADRSVDVQMNRLRRKIETDLTNPRWLMTVRGQGYRLAVES